MLLLNAGRHQGRLHVDWQMACEAPIWWSKYTSFWLFTYHLEIIENYMLLFTSKERSQQKKSVSNLFIFPQLQALEEILSFYSWLTIV